FELLQHRRDACADLIALVAQRGDLAGGVLGGHEARVRGLELAREASVVVGQPPGVALQTVDHRHEQLDLLFEAIDGLDVDWMRCGLGDHLGLRTPDKDGRAKARPYVLKMAGLKPGPTYCATRSAPYGAANLCELRDDGVHRLVGFPVGQRALRGLEREPV